MLRRMVRKSLWIRWSRVVVAVLSVVTVAALASALGNLWQSSPVRAREQLRKYGANLLVMPKEVTWLSQMGLGGAGYGTGLDWDQVRDVAVSLGGPSVVASAPSLFTLVESNGKQFVAQGTDLEGLRALNPWWDVEGAWPGGTVKSSQVLVGAEVARALGLKPGSALDLKLESRSGTFAVVGILASGTSEESQVLLDLEVTQELARRQGSDLIQLSVLADEAELKKMAKALEAQIPGIQVRVVAQMAEAEANIMGKIRILMASAALAVAVAAGVAVFSTLSASVLERTPEIGLMRALGAEGRHISTLFGAETAVLALVGGVVGYPLGVGMAQLIGLSVFGSGLEFSLVALPAALGAAAIVTAVAAILPVRRAITIPPLGALRSE